MLSSLNFLPADNKKQLLKVFLLRITQRVVFLITVITFIFSLSIVGLTFLLQIEVDNIVNQHETIKVYIGEESGETFDEAIQELNTTTMRLQEIQSDYTLWTDVLATIGELIPEDVVLENIALTKLSQSVSIRGVASTREAYNALRNNFTSSEYIEEVVIPISLLKEDIPFSITATTKPLLYAEK